MVRIYRVRYSSAMMGRTRTYVNYVFLKSLAVHISLLTLSPGTTTIFKVSTRRKTTKGTLLSRLWTIVVLRLLTKTLQISNF